MHTVCAIGHSHGFRAQSRLRKSPRSHGDQPSIPGADYDLAVCGADEAVLAVNAVRIDWGAQRALVIAPHPDDEVIGCGGLISRIKREGGQVHVLYAVVDDLIEYSKAGHSSTAQRLAEITRVAEFFPLDAWQPGLVGQGATLRLDTMAQTEIVDLLEGRPTHQMALPVLRPTVVLSPEITSYNQDHAAIARATLTALRPGPDASRWQPPLVLAYEEPADGWSGATVAAASRNFFVELTADDLDRKIAALKLHGSQWREHPHTRSEDALRGLAAVRGAQSGFAYAEAFACLRWRS
ncbi:LmbE family N-acetylglucosaminyl deacetylase [Nocardia fluminea]|uniref:LmbE family N-acetylglucosaminyl deacetylase n=1 Tax=Nocardia fluminea TaxID=134984 RepID=A0A2N3VD54_9NOCA|nr:LmbE family N-acetylglucosaminyl deacetylase [Nocardia fluminea]